MTTLYERLMARIDELEAALVPDLHRRPWWQAYIEAGVAQLRAGRDGQGRETPLAYSLHIWAYAHPDVVRRALAEDRDILRRHALPDRVPIEDLPPYPCEWGSRRASDPACTVWVDWPCEEIRSLARRHGVEVEGR